MAAILESHLIPAGEDSALRRDPFDLQAFLDERNRYLLPKIAHVTGATISGSEVPDSYLDPSRPFSNELALRRVLGRLGGSVFWYEQHMPGKVLDVLNDALDRERVTSVRLLSGPSNVTEKTKRAFERFKTELMNEGVTCEWHVAPAATIRGLHARVIFDEQLTFELPPLNSLLAGTVDSIRESDIPHRPFEAAWEDQDAAALRDFQPSPQPPSASGAVSAEDSLRSTAMQDAAARESSPHESTESSVGSPDEHGEAGSAEREPWTASEMVDAIRRGQGAGAASAAEAILGWATDHDPELRIWFSSRATGSFMPGLDIRGGAYLFPVAIYSSGTVEVQFQHMIGRPQRPFDDEQRRREFQSRLNEIKGLSIPDDRLDKRPGFRISTLASKDDCSQFLGILDWAFGQAISAIEHERARLTDEPSILVELTEGAARRHYMLIRGQEAFFPADAFGGSKKSDAGRSITLHFSGTNETVETDITDWQGFRCRAPIGRFFVFHDVQGGDHILIERTGERAYRLERTSVPKDARPQEPVSKGPTHQPH